METLFEDVDFILSKSADQEAKERGAKLKEKLELLKTNAGLKKIVGKARLTKAVKSIEYTKELEKLQGELIKLQNWVADNQKRVAIFFEGRDAAGKGGAIKRFVEALNPRKYRTVALPKPTEIEAGQFYFQRYMTHLPNPGEIVFFDRSWYNRAVVEPVFGFCTKDQYERFMREVPEMEQSLINDGIILIKFWFSVSKETQQERFDSREHNPLKQWKLSPVDKLAQKKWDEFTFYKEQMFSRTHTGYSPWIIVNSNDKASARLESIRYVLSMIDYDGKAKSKITLSPDPSVVRRYHRSEKIDD
ncbi:polyphosphate kinase 2 [Campylobacterota bacterium]|nr:polyphosphate kinase 2 [Campylobacterota bacterium]GHV06292.1 polyphosphate kinase 2 [Campylobacterota bacterium]